MVAQTMKTKVKFNVLMTIVNFTNCRSSAWVKLGGNSTVQENAPDSLKQHFVSLVTDYKLF